MNVKKRFWNFSVSLKNDFFVDFYIKFENKWNFWIFECIIWNIKGHRFKVQTQCKIVCSSILNLVSNFFSTFVDPWFICRFHWSFPVFLWTNVFKKVSLMTWAQKVHIGFLLVCKCNSFRFFLARIIILFSFFHVRSSQTFTRCILSTYHHLANFIRKTYTIVNFLFVISFTSQVFSLKPTKNSYISKYVYIYS